MIPGWEGIASKMPGPRTGGAEGWSKGGMARGRPRTFAEGGGRAGPLRTLQGGGAWT